ncbi:MAG: metal-dependent phosphohydrolase [Actinomycetota bacterium]
MTTPEVELGAAWRRVAGSGHQTALDHLLECHREPHRRYHTATHVMWVLRHVDAIVDTEPYDTLDVESIRLAAMFHDIVYDPTSGDNEARSAALATRAANDLGWDAARSESVGRLVMATKTHHATRADEAVLVDADLAILGAAPHDYNAYVAGVRAEYAHVAPDAWRSGRRAVLDGFLILPSLFITPYMRDRFEARARANMTAERASLMSPGA